MMRGTFINEDFCRKAGLKVQTLLIASKRMASVWFPHGGLFFFIVLVSQVKNGAGGNIHSFGYKNNVFDHWHSAT